MLWGRAICTVLLEAVLYPCLKQLFLFSPPYACAPALTMRVMILRRYLLCHARAIAILLVHRARDRLCGVSCDSSCIAHVRGTSKQKKWKRARRLHHKDILVEQLLTVKKRNLIVKVEIYSRLRKERSSGVALGAISTNYCSTLMSLWITCALCTYLRPISIW